MKRYRLLPVIAALAVVACATAPQRATPVTKGPQPVSVTGGLGRYMDERARVERVGFRLRKAAASDCAERKQTKPDIGLVVWSLANFQNTEDRARLTGDFGLTNAVTVALAVEGAPAASAGVKNGAIITHVNGEALGEGKGATERYIARATTAAKQGAVRLKFKDGGEATITPETVCEFPTLLVRSDDSNAAADGTVLAITTGLLQLTESDDEVALILGHELAHNVLRHLELVKTAKPAPGTLLDAFAKSAIGTAVAATINRPFSVQYEKDADRAGLTFMARAGYNIDAAPAFWKRLNETTKAKSVAATHPTGPERQRAIEAAVAEIKAKQKKGEPLTLKPRR
ncbi:MAG: M48 family metalloprotease [Alphaproteobacteria bacterium]|nr:M48 family metalloprotease [Alphaproteobacteria bacterium]